MYIHDTQFNLRKKEEKEGNDDIINFFSEIVELKAFSQFGMLHILCLLWDYLISMELQHDTTYTTYCSYLHLQRF